MAPTAIAVAPPFSAWEWTLAFRYLGARRRNGGVGLTSLLSFFGIVLAVAVLVATMSVMNGFKVEFQDRFLGFNGHAYLGGPILNGPDPYAMARLKAIPGVTSVIPMVEDRTIAFGPGEQSLAFVRGVKPEDMRKMKFLDEKTTAGSLEAFERGAIVGKGLATKLKLAVGDDLVLVAFGPNYQVGDAIERQRIPIVGTFDVGMSQFDDAFVYMPMETAQAVLSKAGRVDAIQVNVTDPERVGDYTAAFAGAAGPGVIVRDWRDINSEFAAVLVQQRNMMRIILLAIVAIAALNMGSGLIMLVKNKGRDIAILRTIGARRGSVMRIFLISGASVGVLAAPAGLGLGLLICAYIKEIQAFIEGVTQTKIFDPAVYFLTTVPARVDWGEVTIVMAWTLAVSIVATLPFAWRAGRIDPVEALRYE